MSKIIADVLCILQVRQKAHNGRKRTDESLETNCCTLYEKNRVVS